MKEQKQDMKLPKLDDLFTTQEERDYAVAEKVQEIDISKISNFPDHPFKVNDDEKMQDMVKSIKEYGVILPVIVRPKEDGTYEMISGHRRKRACELAGVKQIRCIVKNLSDDEATILMVDSNIQREEILPSEKAFAYKMKLEAMKHQGKNIDIDENETSAPMVPKLTSREILGEEMGESRENIRRYIRFTKLIPELLDEVDSKRIAFRPAVELSYLSDENQYVVLNKLEFDEVSPSLSQAIILKKMEQEGTITEEKIEELLDKEKPNQKEFIKIHNEKIDRYIPTKIKETGNVEDFIILCVQEHNKRERLKQQRDAR
jgi:ParB family chromosome partitioning protein